MWSLHRRALLLWMMHERGVATQKRTLRRWRVELSETGRERKSSSISGLWRGRRSGKWRAFGHATCWDRVIDSKEQFGNGSGEEIFKRRSSCRLARSLQHWSGTRRAIKPIECKWGMCLAGIRDSSGLLWKSRRLLCLQFLQCKQIGTLNRSNR